MAKNRKRVLATGTLIELHVDSFDTVLPYYKKMGFKVRWKRSPEGPKGYLVLTMGNNVLCFWCGNEEVYKQKYFSQFPKDTPRGVGVEPVIMVTNVEDYYEKVRKFANVVAPLKQQPWGLKDFRCVDPAGYYLRYTTVHDVRNPKYAVK